MNGPDGTLRFTQSDGNAIGRITPSGKLSRFRLQTEGNTPYGITFGPDGNLWFTERLAKRLFTVRTEQALP